MRYLIMSYGVGLVLLGLYPLQSEYGSLLEVFKSKTSFIASGEWIPESLPNREELGFQIGGAAKKQPKPFRLEPFKRDVQEQSPVEEPLVKQEQRNVDVLSKKSWSFWEHGSAKDDEKQASDSLSARDRDELRALLGEVEE